MAMRKQKNLCQKRDRTYFERTNIFKLKPKIQCVSQYVRRTRDSRYRCGRSESQK